MIRKCYFLTNKNKPNIEATYNELLTGNRCFYTTCLVNNYDKHCISYNNNLPGFINFYKDIKYHIDLGSLLMTGDVFSVTEKTDDVSFSTVNSRLADTIVLDFTNYRIPKINSITGSFRQLLPHVLDSLPAEFRATTCIAIAKSEYGLNLDNLDMCNHYLFSGYIVFWLDNNVTSELLQRYLYSLNCDPEYSFCKSIRLADTRNEVDYCISPSAALPNYSIKLSIPKFRKYEDNPFPCETDSRVLLVEKSQLRVPISASISKYSDDFVDMRTHKLAVNRHLTNNTQDTIPDKVRIEAVSDFTILRDKQLYISNCFVTNADLFERNYVIRVCYNPRPFKLKYIIDIGDFSIFSAGVSSRGDFFCYRYDPYYLFPLRQGCAYIFDNVDRDTYEYHLYNRLIRDKKRIPPFLTIISEKRNSLADKCNDQLLEKVTNKSALDVFEPVCYICSTHGGIVLGLQSRKFNRFFTVERISEGKVKSIGSWYRQMRRHLPEYASNILLRLQTIFDPASKSGIDYDRHICNLFHPTAFMMLKKTKGKPIQYTDVEEMLSNKCPKINHLIRSALGGSNEALAFVCWLGKIIQKKKKTKLAWILQGVQGTGKGLLADLVLRILYGDYFVKCGVSMFDDKFDSWKDNALIVFVDEYTRHAHDKKSLALARIKELITEDTLSSRKMFSHYKEVNNYSNYIFATNVSDAMSIEASDRRFNVGNWQHLKFEDSYAVAFSKSFVYSAYVKEIRLELEHFARILNNLEYGHILDKPLINDSKILMANLSESVEQTFIRLLGKGDFVGLSTIFEYSDARVLLPAAQIAYATWYLCIIDLYEGKRYSIKNNGLVGEEEVLVFKLPIYKAEICALYSAFSDRKCSFKQLYNLIQYMFPVSKRLSRTFCKILERKQGYLVTFYINMKELKELTEDNLPLKNKIEALEQSAEFEGIV